MKSYPSRRDFLKLVSLLPFTISKLPEYVYKVRNVIGNSDQPNVLILVFDALSALNVSLYGYQRETMPNLARFAEKATVFHSHYSAGNYTTPGVASLLTGTYPWTNRGFSHQATVLEKYSARNIFSEFSGRHYTQIGFSHNLLVNILLYQFRHNLNEFTLPNEIVLADYNFSDDLFFKDYGVAVQGERVYLKKPAEVSNSLFLFPIFWALKSLHKRYLKNKLEWDFPRGIPGYHDMLYPLEDTIDWIMQKLRSWPQPFLAYMHMMPPHDPYYPKREFINIFPYSFESVPKPAHFFSEGHSEEVLFIQRIYYDEYIAYVDSEFGRLYDFMQENGILDNTWVVFTSDHGEMFEREIWKHTTPTVYQPIIRVPLLISEPGQAERRDVYTSTTCIDLLPTLLHVTGGSIPEWCEGEILPPYVEKEPDINRSIFVVEAKSNPKYHPLTKSTFALIKGQYKLIYYIGYDDFNGVFELYDLANDPDELNDLYDSSRSIALDLTNELLTKIQQVNEEYLANE